MMEAYWTDLRGKEHPVKVKLMPAQPGEEGHAAYMAAKAEITSQDAKLKKRGFKLRYRKCS